MHLGIGLAIAATATVDTYEQLLAAATNPAIEEIVVTASIQGVQVDFDRPVTVRGEGDDVGVPSLYFGPGTDGSLVQDLVFGTDMELDGDATSHLEVEASSMRAERLTLTGASGLYALRMTGATLIVEDLVADGFDRLYPAIYVVGDADSSYLEVNTCSVEGSGGGFVQFTGSVTWPAHITLNDCEVSGANREDNLSYAVWAFGTATLDVNGGRYFANDGTVFFLGSSSGDGSGVSATFDGVTFQENTGQDHPVIYAPGADSLVVENSHFCGNAGNKGGQSVHADGTPTSFRYNTVRGSEGLSAVLIQADDSVIENNTFIEHDFALALSGARASLVNNLFVDIDETVRATGDLAIEDQGYNAWSDAVPGIALSETELTLLDGPGFLTERAEDCDWQPFITDDSPLVDAGDPSRTDADGSRSDIGAFTAGAQFEDDDEAARSWLGGGCSASPLGGAWLLGLLLARRRCS